MIERRRVLEAAHRADTCGMDESQVAAVVDAVLDELRSTVNERPGNWTYKAADWLRDIRNGMR